MESEELYQKALDKWGIELQENLLVEECSELIKAVMKLKRVQNNIKPISLMTNFFEELVDVEIMIEQMKVYYKHRSETLKDLKEYKLYRLEERLNDDF